MSTLITIEEIPGFGGINSTGWLPPTPDLRDYTTESNEIGDILDKIKLAVSENGIVKSLPTNVSLREWCSPVRNQGLLYSCTAFAVTGMIEYFERRAFSKFISASPLFLYKVSRSLKGQTGDAGAQMRDAMKALAMFGVPDEVYWPYSDREADFDAEPTAFVYAIAGNYKALNYFCHDPQGAKKPADVLYSVKQCLAAGIPSVFGFWRFPCFDLADKKGHIPYPSQVKYATIGHAVVAVGYDDVVRIDSKYPGVEPTTGALLIRNCQGEGWGDGGYGWLPYEYVYKKLALDFWSLISMDWIDTGKFGISDNLQGNV